MRYHLNNADGDAGDAPHGAKIFQTFHTYLLTRSNRIEEDLIDQLFNSSEKRLARLLLLLANFGKNAKPTPIDASINQATLAEMIGTTRSRVSFFLNKFRKLGLISYNGKIEVHRSLLNAVLYEKPELELPPESDLTQCAVLNGATVIPASFSACRTPRAMLTAPGVSP
jgi:Crp-like helix-turn-helix domain